MTTNELTRWQWSCCVKRTLASARRHAVNERAKHSQVTLLDARSLWRMNSRAQPQCPTEQNKAVIVNEVAAVVPSALSNESAHRRVACPSVFPRLSTRADRLTVIHDDQEFPSPSATFSRSLTLPLSVS